MTEIATRDAYGKRLAELGAIHPQIVVMDADLSGSTKTGVFAKKFPERFFNVGVAEQDLMGTAAGLAASGKTVFVSTFAIFATGRAWEPIRQSIAYPHLNVKVCASHAGLSVGEDGASHQMIEDVALMRVIPGMKVYVPADATETEKILDFIVTQDGPCYVRLSRPKCPVLFDASYTFKPGRGHVMRQGKQVAIISMGLMVTESLQAAEILESQGISATVVNMASVKPIDDQLLATVAASHEFLVTVEEHVVIGGLGSAVCESLSATHPKKVLRLGRQDEFGHSGEYKAVFAHYGLSAEGIAKSIAAYMKS